VVVEGCAELVKRIGTLAVFDSSMEQARKIRLFTKIVYDRKPPLSTARAKAVPARRPMIKHPIFGK
jgi:hypothetical protein